MKADVLKLMADLMNANKVLFRIPVYQRNYDWSDGDCNRLLSDIKTIIDTGNKHFLGTICYMATSGNDFVLHDYVVIDGQQRLTTMTIFLKALYDAAKAIDDKSTMEDINDYLLNRNCAEDYKIKLKPVKTDRANFAALLEGKEVEDGGNIYHNYALCQKRIEKWIDSGITPADIMKALYKLEIVGISLKEGEDDPQVIFESINSTGLALSNADLIRNFLLMSDQDQESLYEDYWLPIEANLRRGNDYSNLNLFFAHYIILKTGMPVNERKLYQSFTAYYKDKGYTHEGILKELKSLSEIYKAFVDGEGKSYSFKVNKALRGLKQMKQTTCYPFLLHVFDDYEHKVIDGVALENTVTMIHAYLVRRGICGIPTNSLRGLFTYLYSRVFKVPSNKKKYYEAINKFLFTLTSRDVMPSDQEFRNALLNNNLYGNLSLCRFLLTDIENGDGKETLKAENLTIEHIMPQTMTREWRQYISDEEHELYLHTLGNLSVTGYNSEMSNKTFSEKKAIIDANSKAVILNKDVTDKDVWTADCIKKRARRLAKIVMDRYTIERVDDPTIEYEYVAKVTLNDDYHAVTGKKLVSFTFEGETYPQNRYALMLMDIVKLLDEKDPKHLEELALKKFSFNAGKKHAHISKNEADQRGPWEVRDGIFIESNLSASGIMHFIDSLIDEYDIDRNSFYVSIMAEEPTEEEDEETIDEE